MVPKTTELRNQTYQENLYLSDLTLTFAVNMILYKGISYLQFFYNWRKKMETLSALFWNLLVPTLVVAFGTWLFYQVKKFYGLFAKKTTVKIKKNKPINKKWSVQQLIGDFSELLPEVHVNPAAVWLIRLGLSAIIAILSFLILLFLTAGTDNIFLDYGKYLATAFIFYLIYKEEKVVIHSPKQHVVVVTIFGTEIPVYLIDGDFPWYGTVFKFGISNHPGMPASSNKHSFITAAEQLPGRINTAVRTLPIWVSETDRTTRISEFSKDRVKITANYTVSIQTKHPKEWLKFNNAVRQICDISRSAILELNSLFIIGDFRSVISESQELLKGNRVILAFASDKQSLIDPYSVARDHSGKPVSVVIDKKKIEEAISDPQSPITTEEEYLASKISEFEAKLKQSVDAKTLQNAFTTNDKIHYSVIELTNSIAKIAGDTGSEITQIAISGVTYPEEYEKAMQQVNIEAYEMASEKATTESIVNNAKLMPTDNKDLALVLSSTNSGLKGVNINFTTGSSSNLEKAASIIANKE